MRLLARLVPALAAASLGAAGGCAGVSPAGSAAPGSAASPAGAPPLELLLAERRAGARLDALRTWYAATRGVSFDGADDPAADQALLEALSRPAPAAGGSEALVRSFVRNELLRRAVRRATAPFDRALAAAEASAVVDLPFAAAPIALRDASQRLAGEADPARRTALESARERLIADRLEPLLRQREAAAQGAARALGARDYVALSEELVGADLGALLAGGALYVRATEAPFRAALDRVAREELGIGREQLTAADLPRLWAAPGLARYFPPERAEAALRWFLGGLGLSLRTAAGTWVQLDFAPAPLKRARAFTVAVDAPADVRVSLAAQGGLGGYWALFHEAGHAVHFAQATLGPPELRTLGHAAPGEAFGELFRLAFADPRFLLRYRDFLARSGGPVPSDRELASVARRTALREMALVRRYAFAQVAWELRLHGRPLPALGPALPLLADPSRAGDGPDELYRQLVAVAEARPARADEAASALLEVDDFFYAADYARAFALASALREALCARFGEAWSEEPAAGALLRERFFAEGTSRPADELASRLGPGFSLDFGAAAERSIRLLALADSLEAPTAQKGRALARSATLGP